MFKRSAGERAPVCFKGRWKIGPGEFQGSAGTRAPKSLKETWDPGAKPFMFPNNGIAENQGFTLK